ncbi:MAG: hypothetical protein AAGE61_14150 [Pseudomonadota bacterium]
MKRPARIFHRRFWLVAGLGLPIVFLGLMAMKQTKPVETPAVQLEAPDGS